MDQLAEHLEYNAVILGGTDSLLIRTGNPDGLQHRAVTTANGLELKNAFPKRNQFKLNVAASSDRRPNAGVWIPQEVVFLVRTLKQFQPSRVILIGQSDNANGAVLYSPAAKESARRFADAVDLADYPLNAREQSGSFERLIAESGVEVVSVQLPVSTTVESGWPRFGVWLPSLLAESE